VALIIYLLQVLNVLVLVAIVKTWLYN